MPTNSIQDSLPATPKRRRRWLQFSLRSLLIAMLVFGLLLGWLAYQIQLVAAQANAAAEIDRLGGNAMECHLMATNDVLRDYSPTWLQDSMGEKYFETINYASLDKATDDDLVLFQSLSKLRALHLNSPHVTDDGLIHLRPLRQLESLSFVGANITDRGLIPICQFTNLQYLNLSSTRITDAGLAKISKLPNLRLLELDDTAITDAGLQYLQNLPDLESLSLEKTQLTDRGLATLHTLKKLLRIEMKQTHVTDAGVAALKSALPKLDVFR